MPGEALPGAAAEALMTADFPPDVLRDRKPQTRPLTMAQAPKSMHQDAWEVLNSPDRDTCSRPCCMRETNICIVMMLSTSGAMMSAVPQRMLVIGTAFIGFVSC